LTRSRSTLRPTQMKESPHISMVEPVSTPPQKDVFLIKNSVTNKSKKRVVPTSILRF